MSCLIGKSDGVPEWPLVTVVTGGVVTEISPHGARFGVGDEAPGCALVPCIGLASGCCRLGPIGDERPEHASGGRGERVVLIWRGVSRLGHGARRPVKAPLTARPLHKAAKLRTASVHACGGAGAQYR